MTQEKHNGWTNYATWRINLEHFDGINFVRDDVWGDSIPDFSEQLKGDVEARLDDEFNNDTRQDSIALSYAQAFISDVNWYEIAESINDTYKLGLK